MSWIGQDELKGSKIRWPGGFDKVVKMAAWSRVKKRLLTAWVAKKEMVVASGHIDKFSVGRPSQPGLVSVEAASVAQRAEAAREAIWFMERFNG